MRYRPAECARDSRSDSRRALDESIERAWLAMGSRQGWGSHLYRPSANDETNKDFVPRHLLDGGAFWEAALSNATPAVWDQHATLRLTRDQAKELQRELATIVNKYANQNQGMRPTAEHLLHLALAPRET